MTHGLDTLFLADPTADFPMSRHDRFGLLVDLNTQLTRFPSTVASSRLVSEVLRAERAFGRAQLVPPSNEHPLALTKLARRQVRLDAGVHIWRLASTDSIPLAVRRILLYHSGL
jgi:hypothetical protein